MKEVVFLGDTQSVIREWSEDVRKEIGHQLFRVQNGFNPEDFKPHKTIGNGVQELRVKIGNEYRVIYTVKFDDAIYVLTAFKKKTQKTPKQVINLAKRRLREIA